MCVQCYCWSDTGNKGNLRDKKCKGKPSDTYKKWHKKVFVERQHPSQTKTDTVHAIIPVSDDPVIWQKLRNVGELAQDPNANPGKRRYVSRVYTPKQQKRVWDVVQVDQNDGRIRPKHTPVLGSGSSSSVPLPERGPDLQQMSDDELIIVDEPQPKAAPVRKAKSIRTK